MESLELSFVALSSIVLPAQSAPSAFWVPGERFSGLRFGHGGGAALRIEEEDFWAGGSSACWWRKDPEIRVLDKVFRPEVREEFSSK